MSAHGTISLDQETWQFFTGGRFPTVLKIDMDHPGKKENQTACDLGVSASIVGQDKATTKHKTMRKYPAQDSLGYNPDTLVKHFGSGPRNLSCASITISWTRKCAATWRGSTARIGDIIMQIRKLSFASVSMILLPFLKKAAKFHR